MSTDKITVELERWQARELLHGIETHEIYHTPEGRQGRAAYGPLDALADELRKQLNPR
jgi:hypothetical protein